ncbi:TatD family hydrolase [Lonsdalea britannica]|uniref:TatD family hydrolase n=1 Tax=Lonsdalea britannica TaxID=1082704 RepID=UPI0026E9F4A9|nr:TatD family hydrolase [Lonsdalea britannica]
MLTPGFEQTASQTDRRSDTPGPLIDTHCHFDVPLFLNDESDSLRRAQDAGITDIIIPAVDAHHFDLILQLAQRWPGLHAALGLHPLYIDRHDEKDLALLDARLQSHRESVVAVGEIGLDLYMDDPQFDRQCHFLGEQLALARRHDLPVILHSRRTHDRLAAILRRYPLPRTGVVHGFSGSYEQAMAFIRQGFYIGVGGTITYPRASKTRKAIAKLPLEFLLLETDAPDMPVSGHQGAPNRPERLRDVFASLCELREETSTQLVAALWTNSQRLFQLSEMDEF